MHFNFFETERGKDLSMYIWEIQKKNDIESILNNKFLIHITLNSHNLVSKIQLHFTITSRAIPELIKGRDIN